MVMAKRVSKILLVAWLGMVGCGPGGAPPPQSPFQPDTALESQPVPTPPPPTLAESDWRRTSPAAGPLVIHTDPGDLPQLQAAGGKTLVLEHTHVSAKLNGFVAEVEVSQTFDNPSPQPIEAVYVFPLPENSAVNHLRMVIGERIIEADVKERGQARRIYEHAKREGQTAALLEQERPNVFTQSVANIEPGKKIQVVVRYLQDLTYDAGGYEFVFPMVVGPRYMPGEPLGGAPSGGGTKPDTTRVPDASRISPPFMGQGERSGRSISLELVADAQQTIGDFEVPTHQVVQRRPPDGTLRLTLAEKASIPNRDFVLRYRVAGPAPKATLLTSGGDSGYFSLVVQPPDLDVEGLVGQREFVFVVDVSGSMSGQPLAMCKAALRSALSRLRPVDTFNILTFSGATRQAFQAPRPANVENLRAALSLIDSMGAGGGTNLGDAVVAALSPPNEPRRNRYVFFMTDGYVGNESEILAATQRFVRAPRTGKSRVFGFGVGSSVNRYLIDGLSSSGEGVAVYATTREDPQRGVDRFFHYVDRAVLEQLQVSWDGLQVEETYPSPLPDLFASHPVIVHGRFRGKPSNNITVHALAAGKPLNVSVETRSFAEGQRGPSVLGTLWAREKLAFLDDQLMLGDPSAQADITRLGIDFHLVTRFTSLIAVDTSRTVRGSPPTTVQVPQEGPEGVDLAAAGGERPKKQTASLEGAGNYAPGEGYGYEFQDSSCPGCEVGTEMRAAPAPEPAIAQHESLYSVSRKRGCGCRVAGEPTGSGPLVLLILAVGATVGRRISGKSREHARLE
jgi:Ca-activated chloride channel homolog